MGKYAEKTSVSVAKSKAEIEQTLQKYGASKFAQAWCEDKAMIQFELNDRLVRFVLPMPDADDDEFRYTPSRRLYRDKDTQLAAYEQACRQRWRALGLAIKAKLEAVEAGITVFDEEFLAHIVLPGGGTVGEWMLPQIEEAYVTQNMPVMLPGLAT